MDWNLFIKKCNGVNKILILVVPWRWHKFQLDTTFVEYIKKHFDGLQHSISYSIKFKYVMKKLILG